MAGSLGIIGSVVGIASGVNALTGGSVTNALGGSSSSSTAASTTAAADPFASYRSNLASMYAGALQPGAKTNIASMPGFTQYNTGVMQPAEQAAQRTSASTGSLYSGNEKIALQNTAQQGYYGFMTDYLNRLAQGSGATQSPATAVGMGLAQGNLVAANQQSGLSAIGTSLAGLSNAGGSGTNYGAVTGLPSTAADVSAVDYAYGGGGWY